MPAVYGAIDLQKNELRQAVVQNLGSAPSSPSKGQLWMDSTANVLKWWDGGQWVAAQGGAGVVPSDTVTNQNIGDAAGAGAMTVYSRGDHRHGMPSFSATAAAMSAGVAGAGGSSTQISAGDHVHALPAFGAVLAESAFGSASGNGSATTFSRSDHLHGNPVHNAAAHNTIPLSALSAPLTNIDMFSLTFIGLASPTNPNDAATKGYVDNVAQGLDGKASVRVGTPGANVTLGAAPNTLDGVTLAVNDRVLVKNQSAPAENGIYTVTTLGTGANGVWTRALDMDSWAEVPGAYTWVEAGTALADTGWLSTADAGGTLGTTAITWVLFASAASLIAGLGLTKAGNTIDVGAGTGILVATDSISIDDSVVATDAQVTAAIAPKADKTLTLTAGLGLIGGGDLSANRTFDIGGGNGITVQADGIQVDQSYLNGIYATVASVAGMAKKFAAALTGTIAYATGEVVTHNLNTRDVQVTVLNGSSPYAAVQVDWEATSVNTVTVRYNPNLGAGYRAVVVG
jgi:hypothetical protein